MFRVLVVAAVAFVLSTATTYAVVFFGTLAAWHVLGVVDRDGGGTMGVAFVIAPLIAAIGGCAGATAAGVSARGRKGGPPSGGEERRDDATRFTLTAGALAGGFAGYVIGESAFWLVGPISYDAMWKALAHAWAPTLIMIAGAMAGWLLTRIILRS